MYEIKLTNQNRCFTGKVESMEDMQYILYLFRGSDYKIYKDGKLIKLHQHDLNIIKSHK